MNEEFASALKSAFADVLERQAFMFADACAVEGLETEETFFLRATIGFEGPVRGSVGLAAPLGLCVELASNVLGLETGEDLAAIEAAPDALKELVNVVCGQFLTTACGSGPVFHLSIPAMEEMDPEDWAALLNRGDAAGFSVEGSPMVVCLDLKADGKPAQTVRQG